MKRQRFYKRKPLSMTAMFNQMDDRAKQLGRKYAEVRVDYSRHIGYKPEGKIKIEINGYIDGYGWKRAATFNELLQQFQPENMQPAQPEIIHDFEI